MSFFETLDSTDARVHVRVRRAFRASLALIVTILLLSLGLGRAEAVEHRPRAALEVEVHGTLNARVDWVRTFGTASRQSSRVTSGRRIS